MAELVDSLMAITGVVAVARARREDETGPGASAGQPPYLLTEAVLAIAMFAALDVPFRGRRRAIR